MLPWLAHLHPYQQDQLYCFAQERKQVPLSRVSQLMRGRVNFPAFTPSCQPTNTHTNRVSSTMLPRWGARPSLLSAAVGQRQGHFSLVLCANEGRDQPCSPILTVFGGNRSQGHQQRPRLWQDHGPTHGPLQWCRTGRHHGPEWQPGPLSSVWPQYTSITLAHYYGLRWH